MPLPDEHQERLDEGEFHAITARLDVWEQWPLHRMEFVNGYGADVGNLLAEVERSWAELVVVSERLEQAQATIERQRQALLGAPTPDYAAWHLDHYRKWFRGELAAALSVGAGEQETR